MFEKILIANRGEIALSGDGHRAIYGDCLCGGLF